MSGPISLNAERAKREDDNKLISPIEALQDAIRAIESGEVKADSLLIITLDRGTNDDKLFEYEWFASRISASDILALLEVSKTGALRSMGYLPNAD